LSFLLDCSLFFLAGRFSLDVHIEMRGEGRWEPGGEKCRKETVPGEAVERNRERRLKRH